MIIIQKMGGKGPREMALSVKCLLHKHGCLSSSPQHLCEKAGHGAGDCNPRTEGGELERGEGQSLELTGPA